MNLSIIIPSFNTKKLLKECIDSIRKNKGDLKIEIIVVDNASTDGSAEMIREFAKKHSCQFVSDTESPPKKKEVCVSPIRENSPKPTIRLIENRTNLGFAKAVNQGLKRAKGEHILLLNSDVIVKSGALKEMLNFSERHPLAGIIGGKLVGPEGSIQASVYHFPTILRAVREFWFGQKDTYQKYAPQVDKPVIVDAVTGATMLIPKKIIDEVGLLDERYFMYFEDLDYCRRVKKTGYRTYYLPQVEFVHYHGASGKGIPELTHQWLVQSSKLYNGLLKYYFLTLIIWLGQKWQKVLGKR